MCYNFFLSPRFVSLIARWTILKLSSFTVVPVGTLSLRLKVQFSRVIAESFDLFSWRKHFHRRELPSAACSQSRTRWVWGILDLLSSECFHCAIVCYCLLLTILIPPNQHPRINFVHLRTCRALPTFPRKLFFNVFRLSFNQFFMFFRSSLSQFEWNGTSERRRVTDSSTLFFFLFTTTILSFAFQGNQSGLFSTRGIVVGKKAAMPALKF